MEQCVMKHKVWHKLIPLWKMMLLIICSAWLKSTNKVLLKNIQMFPQAKKSIFNLFSLFKPGAKAGFYYDTTSSCFYLFISAPFLISDKNNKTAEEKGIFWLCSSNLHFLTQKFNKYCICFKICPQVCLLHIVHLWGNCGNTHLHQWRGSRSEFTKTGVIVWKEGH